MGDLFPPRPETDPFGYVPAADPAPGAVNGAALPPGPAETGWWCPPANMAEATKAAVRAASASGFPVPVHAHRRGEACVPACIVAR